MGTDEMSLLRELRAEAPVPDRAALAEGRQRLTEAAGRRRRLRADWRIAAVATAAAVVMGAAVSGQVLGGEQGAQQGASPVVVSELGSAAQVLRDAAGEVADDPVPAPRAGQWVYTKELVADTKGGSQLGGPGSAVTEDVQRELVALAKEGRSGDEAGGLRVIEHWYRYADPDFENGKSGDDHSPRERFQFLADLPSDLEQVKKRARAFYPGEDETTAEHDFRALSVLALSYPADPKGLASVYRAMATIPGIEAVQTQDVLNRPAIGIHLPGERDLLLLNAQTSLYAGEGSLDSPAGFIVTARAAAAVVDEKGRRS
ncbi:CU044_5270 family protein [Streptomyces sp. P01-B04]|uniref:CU044_5270 family protein n=1 Tax=Streptomyces poriferorum TaxID=2798799 RepID=A0ABY9IW39_9ACTN|nr:MULTISPECIES: CU044_5270 family protein [Streptomyces]MBW5254714.1 CU044_5270 family protein [Streptomyces poriferorum]MBW5260956.1 CU044_5270 family protein [Streptomyces poriferorum]MDP5311196.1 CU044_5270 family protein [Streptomyces sp. Alt4]WLQ59692.1 CU044_5270 family protein [Streptomyces sp. Alt2]